MDVCLVVVLVAVMVDMSVDGKDVCLVVRKVDSKVVLLVVP